MNSKIFTDVTLWQRETFEKSTALSKAVHLQSEVIELAFEIEGKRKKEAALELADVFILAIGIAERLNMTYDDVCMIIEQKMEINKARTWGKPDERGVVNHIKS